MKKSVLRSYARLIARTGINIQKGQEVFIAADLDQPEFVAMLVDECYKCKAKRSWWTGTTSPCRSSTSVTAA